MRVSIETTMLRPSRFWVACVVAMLPQLSIAYVSSAAPLQFIVLVVLWNIAPMLICCYLFHCGRTLRSVGVVASR